MMLIAESVQESPVRLRYDGVHHHTGLLPHPLHEGDDLLFCQHVSHGPVLDVCIRKLVGSSLQQLKSGSSCSVRDNPHDSVLFLRVVRFESSGFAISAQQVADIHKALVSALKLLFHKLSFGNFVCPEDERFLCRDPGSPAHLLFYGL